MPLFQSRYTREEPCAVNAADTAAATHAAASIVYGAVTGLAHAIGGLAVSYSGTTPAGTLTIQDGSTTVFSIDLVGAGVTLLPFRSARVGTPGNSLTVTLSDGGAGVVGKVNVTEHFLLSGVYVTPGMDFGDADNSGLLGAI